MNPILKNNQRVTYLRDLPSAVALHNYIQKLDAKYNINSKDHDNSFGDITLDNPIIKNGINNTLFLAKISTSSFFSESDLLPKHEQVPPANYAIGINKNGNVAILENAEHATAKPKPITIDEADLITLRSLRDAFQKEVEANNYDTPRFIKDNTLIDPTEFFDAAIDHPKAFGNFSRKAQQHICEKIYTEQGFANNPDYNLKRAIPVTYKKDGTVYARKFISFSEEHDHLDTQIGRIKRNQKRGSHHNKTLWRNVSGLSQDIADKTVQAIFDFGKKHNVDVFILEYLDFKGKNIVKRAHFWRYKRIYKVLTQRAHQYGLRIARVNARNTSRLAFDGSGWAKRGREITPETPYALMQFTTGKTYNAELNASYNIGARYFIRRISKTITATQWLALEAKVPQIAKRSTCTLSHLINLRNELTVLIARTQA